MSATTIAPDVLAALDNLDGQALRVRRREQELSDEHTVIGHRGRKQDVSAGKSAVRAAGRIADLVACAANARAAALRDGTDADTAEIEGEIAALEARAAEIDDGLADCRRALARIDGDRAAILRERHGELAERAHTITADGERQRDALLEAIRALHAQRRTIAIAVGLAAAGIRDVDARRDFGRAFEPWTGRRSREASAWEALALVESVFARSETP